MRRDHLWVFAVLATVTIALTACTPAPPASPYKIESVNYSINTTEVSGGIAVLTAIEKKDVAAVASSSLSAAVSGSIRTVNPKQGVVLGFLLDRTQKPVAMDILVAGGDNSFDFNSENTARTYVLYNPLFWGWSAENKAAVFAKIKAHPRFPLLVSRFRNSFRFVQDKTSADLATQIAYDVAVEYTADKTGARSLAASVTGVASQAVISPLATFPRLVKLDQAGNERTLTAQNYGLLSHRIKAYEGIGSGYTLDRLNRTPSDLENSSAEYIDRPGAFFGVIPSSWWLGDLVKFLPIVNKLVAKEQKTELRLKPKQSGYAVFTIVPCAFCGGGSGAGAIAQSPAIDNFVNLVADVLEAAVGVVDIRSDAFKGKVAKVLFSGVDIPVNWSKIIQDCNDQRWGDAVVSFGDWLKGWADDLLELAGKPSTDAVALELFFSTFTSLGKESMDQVIKAVTGVGLVLDVTYAAATAASFFWALGLEYSGNFQTANVTVGGSPRLDVAYVIDTTSSMGGIISTAKARAIDIANRIRTDFPSTRFAVVDFKDYPQSPYGSSSDYPFRVGLDLTTDTARLQSAIGALSAAGGNDLPESHLTALSESAKRLSWNADAFRIVLLISDAPGHDRATEPSYPGLTMQDSVNQLGAKSIKVIGLAASKGAEPFMRELAIRTNATRGGSPAVLPISLSGSDLATQVVDAILGSISGSGLSRSNFDGSYQHEFEQLPSVPQPN